jgi:rhodanese-related sulfurtransferase
LFLGDVGRPDLSPSHTPEQLAGLLFDSLHNKVLKLSNEVLVYPAHGAGSLCGRNMREESHSTIGVERTTNYALQIKDRDEFVRQMTANLPARPDYFSQDAEINRAGAPALAELAELEAISAEELKVRLEQGWVGLDLRPFAQFAVGHVPGSVNIALGGQFASWAGIALGLGAHPVLIAETAEQIEEARTRLARIGMEARGYLRGGIAGWREEGLALATVPEISVQELEPKLKAGQMRVLDVRRESEWQSGHIAGADWWPLDNFIHQLPAQTASPLAVHCKGGYRSAIACSLLLRAGFTDIVNVRGGTDAWQQAGLPLFPEAAAKSR